MWQSRHVLGKGKWEGFSRASEALHQAFAHASIKGLLGKKGISDVKKKTHFGKVEVSLSTSPPPLAKRQTSRLAAEKKLHESESRLVGLRRRGAELAPNAF